MKSRRVYRFILLLCITLSLACDIYGQDNAAESDSPFVAAKEAFPRIEVPVNDQGKPILQTVRLNEKVFENDGGRYSGFRFVVDRAGAAEKQKVADKTTMSFVWFFVPPIKMTSWYIVPMKGTMHGFNNFMPLKLDKFKHASDYLPARKNSVILQQLPADRLVEGEEYLLWFRYPPGVTEPEEMSVGLGYAPGMADCGEWKGVNALIDSLGLDLGGQRINHGDQYSNEAEK